MKVKSLLAPILAASLSAFGGSEGWITDFAAAKQQAAAAKRPLFVFFTGSDWCGWCKRLQSEVFTQSRFKDEVPSRFVMVELDYPRDKSAMAPELIKQNDALVREYKVRGYPTVLLMDAAGAVFAATGYRPGGAEAYVAHLKELLEARAAFETALAAARKLEAGVEKAKQLDKALQGLGADVRGYRKDIIEEICKNDAENAAGLKGRYEFLAALEAFDAARPGDPRAPGAREKFVADQRARLDAIDETFKPTGEGKQEVLARRATVCLYTRDLDAAIEFLKKAKEIAPDSELAKGMIEGRLQSLERARQQQEANKPK